jgi:hypothetical protein
MSPLPAHDPDLLAGWYLEEGWICGFAPAVGRVAPDKSHPLPVCAYIELTQFQSFISGVGSHFPALIKGRYRNKNIPFPPVIKNPGQGLAIAGSLKLCWKRSGKNIPD